MPVQVEVRSHHYNTGITVQRKFLAWKCKILTLGIHLDEPIN